MFISVKLITYLNENAQYKWSAVSLK